jgi:hypothetical protein
VPALGIVTANPFTSHVSAPAGVPVDPPLEALYQKPLAA